MPDPLILEYRQLLRIEWQRNHDRECPRKFDEETEDECDYPQLEILREPIEGESICDSCGEPYIKQKNHQRFCSTNCRVRDWKRWNHNRSTIEDSII